MTDATILLAALPVATYTTDAEGTLTYFNEAAATLWGRRPDLGQEKWTGAWRMYRTDGSLLAHDECALAISLKQGRAVRGDETILERPDGTQVLFVPFPALIKDDAGKITGAINTLQDMSDRTRSETEAARLAAIVYSSDDAIVSKTLAGLITSWNAAAESIFGYTEAEMLGQPIIRIIPNDLRHEEEQIISRIKQGERIQHYETTRLTKTGGMIDISLTVSPILDKHGRVIGASKVARDITARKKAERLQQLLTNELDHRVKNTLATVQAIATQSLHHAKTPTDFAESFSGRIQAMATAHSLLTQNHKIQLHGADIMELVRNQVLLGGGDPRVSYTGPNLILETQEAVHLSLVLHELATNARKYGALSTPNGSLSINWFTRVQELVLEWNEQGGPTVTPPTQLGFGSTLIRTTLKAHGGEATVVYAPGGLKCTLKMPLRPEQDRGPAFNHRFATEQQTSQRRIDLAAQAPCRRVLVVEDEPLVSMDIETALESAGHTVVGPVATLDAAKKLAAEGAYDVALLDVNLAGTSIEDVAEIVAGRRIPFSFVTGYGHAALPARFKGGTILSKPFNHSDVLSMVNRLTQPVVGDGDMIPFARGR